MDVHTGLELQGWRRFTSQAVTEVDAAAVALQTEHARVPSVVCLCVCLVIHQKKQEGYSHLDNHGCAS